MDPLIATSTSLLLVNLLFAAIALAVGFAAGTWVAGSAQPNAAPDKDAENSEPPTEKVLAEERAMMATDRLRDLAASMASDVGTHTENIGAIQSRLQDQSGDAASAGEAVAQALNEISDANSALKDKLAKAEEQIKAQAEQIRTHESEARTDSLTGIANRRAFDDELKRRLSEWSRHETPCSLLILDVDHFKNFNDTHGHQAGDEVLRKVGETISECCRDMDVPCRYGGEEFAIIMPATAGSEGNPLAERVRSSIEEMTVEFEGKTLNVTASFGLASSEPGDSPVAMIKRADEALYAAKDAGRNNAHRFTDGECVPITPGKMNTEINEEAREADKASSLIDSLPNRTRFLDALRDEVEIAHESGTSLSVLTADLQGYEKLNSEFGESVARLTLDSVARFLRGALGEEDLLGRLGEGHFVALMPRQSAENARRVGERINTALANCTVPLGDSQIELTTTMTVTELQPEDTAVSMMRRAEAAASALISTDQPAAVV